MSTFCAKIVMINRLLISAYYATSRSLQFATWTSLMTYWRTFDLPSSISLCWTSRSTRTSTKRKLIMTPTSLRSMTRLWRSTRCVSKSANLRLSTMLWGVKYQQGSRHWPASGEISTNQKPQSHVLTNMHWDLKPTNFLDQRKSTLKKSLVLGSEN